MRALMVLAGVLSIAGSAGAVDIEGNKNLPPCNPYTSLTYDCHITDWNMAINMMTNPPSRERQPNAYYEYLQYERERERNSRGTKMR